MSEENILFDADARARIAAGIDTLANTVKVTLGPRGRNVIVDAEYGNPRMTKDGVSVARAVKVAGKFESIGVRMAKQVAEKQVEEAGDGTTTVTVLLQALVNAGNKAVNSGLNPMDLKRGMDLAIADVIKHIEEQAVEISDLDSIHRVAMVSANGDKEIADIIRKAIEQVGQEGVLTVEESRLSTTTLEVVQGLMFDRGLMSPIFVNKPEAMSCVLEDPVIIIYDAKMTRLGDISPFLEDVIANGRSLLMIAEDYETEVMHTLMLNRRDGQFRVCPVKTPAFGAIKDALLDDISVLTGAPVFRKDGDPALDTVRVAMCGGAERVIIKRDSTVIIGGKGSKKEIAQRCANIRKEIETSSGTTKSNLEVRLATLNAGIAVIRVGGSTDVEVKEKKDRVDDAIHAVKAAIKGGVVAGGGCALIHAMQMPIFMPKPKAKRCANRDQQVGVEIVEQAIQAPLAQIAENGGKNGSFVVQNMRQEAAVYSHEIDEPVNNFGYNAQEGENETDMFAAGIIDPANVVIAAIRNAGSAAGLIITTQSVVTQPEEKGVKNDRG